MPEPINKEALNNEPSRKPTDLLTEILATDREILKSVKFLKNYFKWQVIWGVIKWTILIAIIIFGFISLRSVGTYLQSYGDVFKSYSDQLEGSKQSAESLKNLINLQGR
jgi:hypothetical protein